MSANNYDAALELNADRVQYQARTTWTYFSIDDGGKVYYSTVRQDDGQPVDHGYINDSGKLEHVDAVKAPYIFPGERYENLLEGDAAPELNKQELEAARRRAKVAPNWIITLEADDAGKLADDLRRADPRDDFDGKVAVMSLIDGEYTASWSGIFRELHGQGKDVYIRGAAGALVDLTAKCALEGGARRVYLVPMSKDSTRPIDVVDDLDAAANLPLEKFLQTLREVSIDYQDAQAEKDYLGKCRELADRLDAEKVERLKRSLQLADDWTQSIELPAPFDDAARAVANKYHAPLESVAAIMLTVFLARQGHERARLHYQGRVIYPYMGVIVIGSSGAGKSPIIKDSTLGLVRLDAKAAESERERKKNLDPLRKAHKSASDDLAKAILTTAKATNDADKERAEKAEKHARDVYEAIDRDYKRANARAHKSLLKYESAAGVKLQLAANAANARTLDETNDGALVCLDEAARLLSVTQGTGYGLDVFAALSELIDVTTNGGRTVKGEGAGDKYEAGLELGAAILAGIQTGTIKADKITALLNQGFLNRFFWVYLPYTREATDSADIKDALAPWYSLFKVELPPNVYSLDGGASAAYEEWRRGELVELRNRAYDAGDDATVGFLAKLDNGVLRVALGFHLVLEAAKLDDGRATLPRLLIDASTMQKAVDACKMWIDTRAKSLRQIEATRGSDDVAVGLLEAMTPYEKAEYTFLLNQCGTNGQPRFTGIDELNKAGMQKGNGLNFYRDKTKRGIVEQGLLEKGLIVIDSKTKKRRAVIALDENQRAALNNTQRIFYNGIHKNQEELEKGKAPDHRIPD